jgi:circadian clock protein KaiB
MRLIGQANEGEVMMVAATRKSSEAKKPAEWDLWLYVNDKSPRSLKAFNNLNSICAAHLSGRYHIEVIDVLAHPEAARADQIVALPTLIRKRPKPVRTGIGDLTNTGRLLDLLIRK